MLLAALTADASTNAPPKQVLLLHSFGRDFAPFYIISEGFRSKLAQQFDGPVEFHDLPVESARDPGDAAEGPLANYLNTLFAPNPLNLVVTLGGPAARFAQTRRPTLFPETPMLIAAVDERFIQRVAVTSNDAVIAVSYRPTEMLESIAQVLPETTNIAVVIGSSPNEKFWAADLRQEFGAFSNRFNFVWFDKFGFAEMRKRASLLPPRSAIFYAQLSVDASGVPYTEDLALLGLHEAANAPIFGIQDNQIGHGVVGGRLMALGEVSQNMVNAAVRILQGAGAGQIQIPVQPPGRPIYDWRELRKWRIPEARLPAGSEIRFREPTMWELYKWRIIALISLSLSEAVLIALLVVNLVARRRAERSSEASEEWLNLAMESADVAIWARDFSRDELMATANWRRMFGYAPADVLRQESFLERIHPEDRPAVERAVKDAIQNRADFAAEYRLALPDGSQRWIASRGRLHSGADGKPSRVLGISVDMTERKRAEHEMQHQREELVHVARVSVMGELATSVAHELNQPLGAILSNAEAAELFLDQDPLPVSELRGILKDIRKDDERASEVIRRMRSLLRKHELVQEPLEINSLAEDMLRMVSADAVLRRTTIAADLSPNLPTVDGDRIHLQQVLLNLILNSMDAMAKTPPERRRLVIRSRMREGVVEVSVADTGPGILADHLPQLFDPFFTTKQNGIGMGLAICRKIVEAHHGRIWAENQPSGGAVFRVTLPVSNGMATDQKPSANASDPGEKANETVTAHA
jgi:PAS domain S-box-containing protein